MISDTVSNYSKTLKSYRMFHNPTFPDSSRLVDNIFLIYAHNTEQNYPSISPKLTKYKLLKACSFKFSNLWAEISKDRLSPGRELRQAPDIVLRAQPWFQDSCTAFHVRRVENFLHSWPVLGILKYQGEATFFQELLLGFCGEFYIKQ